MSNILSLKGVKFLSIIVLAVLVLATFGMVAVQQANAALTLGALTVTSDGILTIGGAASTDAITLGSSSGAQTLNLGTGAGLSTVNIATGAGANVINIGGDVTHTAVFDGRISTGTVAGAALAMDADYTLGEAIELRYTTSRTGDNQFQGIFLETRTSAANTSTIRGGEVHAAQEGAIAVGTLEGWNGQAITRSATTGNVTSMYGVTGETTHNDAAYTGTVTNLAAVRGKVSLEDGATYTNSSIFLGQLEAITGGDTIGSILRVPASSGSVTATSVLDINVTATNLLEVTSTGQAGITVGGTMTVSPEATGEDGFITIDVGGTAYQIPIYAQ